MRKAVNQAADTANTSDASDAQTSAFSKFTEASENLFDAYEIKGWRRSLGSYCVGVFGSAGAGYLIGTIAVALAAATTSLILQILIWAFAVLIAFKIGLIAGEWTSRCYDAMFNPKDGVSVFGKLKTWTRVAVA
jgi:hypothetical protein